jgi:hypothetical protein
LQREASSVVGESNVPEIGLHRARDWQLCHGPMETPMPTGVLVRMTFTAGIRSGVSMNAALPWQQVSEAGSWG